MTGPDDLPPLREVIARHGLDARKALGQHFLLDLNITRKIARLAEATPDDRILEIGPGPGGLTRALLESGANVIAIERDDRCLELLGELSQAYDRRLTIIGEDAMRADERAHCAAPAKIVSNLPYNISTELLIKWLRMNHDGGKPYWSRMALMFQKEVADRILAPPGSKTYGRLSVIAQAASRPWRGFDLPARAFSPPPKVDSTVVVFEPGDAGLDIAALEKVTHHAFSQRRKMLRSAMKSLWGATVEEKLAKADVLPTARAEEVSVAQFVTLSAL